MVNGPKNCQFFAENMIIKFILDLCWNSKILEFILDFPI